MLPSSKQPNIKEQQVEEMTGEWYLARTVQCEKCPWKVGTDPHTIPDGYSRKKHLKLRNTIATPGELNIFTDDLPSMACHEDGRTFCIGWIYNQVNEGGNIALRIHMATCGNADKMRVIGPQHPDFDSTIPKQ